jgi:hypothetical protein
MLDTSRLPAALLPSLQCDATVATVGPKDGVHLRIVNADSFELYAIVAVYAGELLQCSCYLRADGRNGYRVQHVVRHPTEAPILDVHAIVRRLLSAKRFNTLLGIQHPLSPIDVLSCGVAVGSCTFLIREFADGQFVAVFDDGQRQAKFRASAEDWNALIEAWEAEDANYGDARRVRIAKRYFRSRGWMPSDVQIFCDEREGEE